MACWIFLTLSQKPILKFSSGLAGSLMFWGCCRLRRSAVASQRISAPRAKAQGTVDQGGVFGTCGGSIADQPWQQQLKQFQLTDAVQAMKAQRRVSAHCRGGRDFGWGEGERLFPQDADGREGGMTRYVVLIQSPSRG
ncbi:hypothetical protein M569_17027 [Genlisea aurea]|uniref:Uncharacterized protein n=1 Tax=Genlisea aurea TaxID=192259 RepID=S8BT54_9LAMI|nr:hypothetical protein M569_17027 [Genlisea aurea]